MKLIGNASKKVFRKYAWATPLEDNKGERVTKAFRRIMKNSSYKRKSR